MSNKEMFEKNKNDLLKLYPNSIVSINADDESKEKFKKLTDSIIDNFHRIKFSIDLTDKKISDEHASKNFHKTLFAKTLFSIAKLKLPKQSELEKLLFLNLQTIDLNSVPLVLRSLLSFTNILLDAIIFFVFFYDKNLTNKVIEILKSNQNFPDEIKVEYEKNKSFIKEAILELQNDFNLEYITKNSKLIANELTKELETFFKKNTKNLKITLQFLVNQKLVNFEKMFSHYDFDKKTIEFLKEILLLNNIEQATQVASGQQTSIQEKLLSDKVPYFLQMIDIMLHLTRIYLSRIKTYDKQI